MKRVALLAYYFPPLGGAGVQRAAKLAEYLPERGWQPVVVTGPAAAAGRWTPHDASLEPAALDVVRVPGPEPGAGGRAERWLRIASPWARWWRDGARGALESLDGVDVVLATLSPFEGARAALDAAATLAVPCVLDLRDPWALDEMFIYPSAQHRAAELRAMRAALGRADAVIVNTQEVRSVLAGLWPELGDVSVVPNGFDPADYDVAPEARDDDAIRIVHTGYLHTELAATGLRARLRDLAGGVLDGVDVGARSHRYLVEAIDRLRAERPDAARFEVHLAGVLSAADELEASRPYLRVRGYLPHAETVALAKSADLLFLPMHDLPSGRRARIVPGKTYEYLATGRPILAAVPDGDARELLGRAGNTLLVRPRDVDGMASALRRVLDGGGPEAQPRASVLAPFERRAIAAGVASVLDRVCAGQARAAA